MVQSFSLVQEIDTEYEDVKVGKLVLLVESMQAVRYAHHYKLHGVELDDVLSFSNTVKNFANEDFTLVRFIRKSLGESNGFYVEVRVLVGNQWRSASYTCVDHLLSFYPK